MFVRCNSKHNFDSCGPIKLHLCAWKGAQISTSTASDKIQILTRSYEQPASVVLCQNCDCEARLPVIFDFRGNFYYI